MAVSRAPRAQRPSGNGGTRSRPKGDVNEAGIGMLSFNHYTFGAVADWMHRVVGGLAPAAPG